MSLCTYCPLRKGFLWLGAGLYPIVGFMSESAEINEILENMRRGPRPLPAFVGMAGLLAGSRDELLRMITGLKMYQAHPYRRPVAEAAVIWQSGSATLRHIAGQGRCHILLVPSMINRAAILDLVPQRSFARWLAGRGIDVYILDWGQPTADPQQQSLADVLDQKLLAAMLFLNEKVGSYHALGYCMGGTLLAGAVHLKPQGLDKVIYLAAPWDFQAGDRQLQGQITLGTPSALQITAQGHPLPSSWIQSVFATVNADRNIHKFADFAAMDQDSDQARLFVAVEDWLNDGVDLPSTLARECLVDWYGQNKPGMGEWMIAGAAVDPARTDNPVLVVTSTVDRLVPEESSHALARMIPHARLLQSTCGHIGMMTGRRAEAEVWQPLADWLTA